MEFGGAFLGNIGKTKLRMIKDLNGNNEMTIYKEIKLHYSFHENMQLIHFSTS